MLRIEIKHVIILENYYEKYKESNKECIATNIKKKRYIKKNNACYT